MKLLLHTCCAPCLIYPAGLLKDKGFEVSGLFYNPNIHPLAEYQNRKNALEVLRESSQPEVEAFPGVPMFYPEYNPQEFFQAVDPVRNTKAFKEEDKISNGVNLKENDPGRCSLCWSLRLKKTAQAARERGFDYFSTTLLVSPYQDQGELKKIGDDVSAQTGIEFYYQDFRPGFRQAHNQARALGIYCQKYCGCIYSEIERTKSKI